MNSNESRTLWISVAAALFAVFLLYSYSQEKKAEYDRRYGSAKRVVVAAQDIAEMETIDDAKLDIIERPVDFIEPDALADPEVAVGQVAAAPIKKGEQILQTKLLSPGPYTGIALQVAPNKRAISIPVDEVRGVSKLIRPGDRIDLLAAMDYGSGTTARKEVKTLMQDVVVLATGLRVVNNIPRLFEVDSGGSGLNRINLNGDTSFNTITIESSPKEAQELIYILATAPGSLYITLRNPSDRLLTRLPATNVNSVLGKTSPKQLRQSFKAPPQRTPQAKKPTPPPRKRKKSGNFEDL